MAAASPSRAVTTTARSRARPAGSDHRRDGYSRGSGSRPLRFTWATLSATAVPDDRAGAPLWTATGAVDRRTAVGWVCYAALAAALAFVDPLSGLAVPSEPLPPSFLLAAVLVSAAPAALPDASAEEPLVEPAASLAGPPR